MAAAHDPSASTSKPEGTAPTKPSADNKRIELPPPARRRTREPLSTEKLARILFRLDVALVLLVLALTFLLGSIAIRNSDALMHLASGRLLARGAYQFGVDPFSFTTQRVPWINHSWLYDLLTYGLYQLGDGAALVVFKAIVLVGLAVVLLRIRRRDQGLFIPAVCVGLAMLAMSSRFLMQPTVFSFLFLGVTLAILLRSEASDEKVHASRDAPVDRRFTSLWLLPPLFALWVNMDDWFLLGPATVALYWLATLLQRFVGRSETGAGADSQARLRTLTVVLIVGVLACLVNPYHVQALRLPAQLGVEAGMDAFKEDPYFAPVFASPLESGYWVIGTGVSAAGIAYVALVLLGIGSFALNYNDWRWSRFALWAGLLGLSAYHARAIPFFAVVGGPLAALNLQEWAARCWSEPRRAQGSWRTVLLAGRGSAIVVTTLSLLAAWPGWLFGVRGMSMVRVHRVSWTIEPEPSHVQVAEQIARWRRDGKLKPDEHGFNLAPDLPNYYAWYCPDEKGFVDFRFELFTSVAPAYEDVRSAINLEREKGQQPRFYTELGWQKLFREHGIRYVVLQRSPSKTPLAAKLALFLNSPEQWTLLYQDGRTFILGWEDSARGGTKRFADMRLDFDQKAFGADPDLAPPDGPSRLARAREWWEAYLTPDLPPSLGGEEADVNLLHFGLQSREPLYRQQILWPAAPFAGLTGVGIGGAATGPSGPFVMVSRFLLLGRPEYTDRAFKTFSSGQDNGPPAALILAVRAARRGIAVNPDDGNAYLQLAQAYSKWENETKDRQWVPRRLPELATIRGVQRAAALHQATFGVLPPETEVVVYLTQHEMYMKLNSFDAALTSLTKAMELLRQSQPQQGVDTEAFRKQIEGMEKQLKDLETEVNNRRNQCEVAAAGKSIVTRAQIALGMGLQEQALNTLLEGTWTDLQQEGAIIELRILLALGQLDKVEVMLTDDIKDTLNRPPANPDTYEMLRVLNAAARGNYEEADAYLGQAIDKYNETPKVLGLMLHECLRYATVAPKPVAQCVSERVLQQLVVENMGQALAILRQQLDYETMRGVLALEAGNIPRARQYFEHAVSAAKPLPPAFNTQGLAERYLELLNNAEKRK
jgi:tetratricopeptide (TPR) repeat protein